MLKQVHGIMPSCQHITVFNVQSVTLMRHRITYLFLETPLATLRDVTFNYVVFDDVVTCKFVI